MFIQRFFLLRLRKNGVSRAKNSKYISKIYICHPKRREKKYFSHDRTFLGVNTLLSRRGQSGFKDNLASMKDSAFIEKKKKDGFM